MNKKRGTGRAAAVGDIFCWREVAPSLGAIAATVVLPRLLVLQVSVFDWDESIYALIGQQWLAGHVPHETVYDHKPAGLFAIFALFQLVFGQSVLAIRMIPVVFVAATAALLARIAYVTLGRDRWLAGFAAALYGLLTLADGGLASNTELLVNFFIILAVFMLFAFELELRVSITGGLAAGACLGFAFQVNFLAGVLVAGVAAFYLAWIAAREPFWTIAGRYFTNGAWMMAGFLAANAFVTLPVALYGDLADYLELKLAYLGGYRGIDDASVAARRISESLLPYWPYFALLVLLAAASWRRDTRIAAWITLALFALFAALASRRFYHHFFLFTVPPLVLLAASWLKTADGSEGRPRVMMLWLLMCGFAAPLSAQEQFVRGIRAQLQTIRGFPPDAVAGTAQYLSERLHAGDTIYVFDGQPVLYYLTRTTPPTRFAFPESHLREDVAARFGTTPVEAVRGILERAPRFIVAQPGPSGLGISAAGILLQKALDRDYLPARAVEAGAPAHLYVRRNPARAKRDAY